MAYLDVPGARLHYEVTGAGRPAFVFIHGGCCAYSDWHNQVAELGREGTVLALDLRGHGQSSGEIADCTVERWAQDVNVLIDALGIGTATIIGHSLGSRIAAEAAWQRPDNADALVLIDGSRSTGGFAATQPPVGGSPPPPGDGSLAAILDATVGPYADAATRRYVIETMSAPSMELMVQTVAAYTEWDEARADIVFASLPQKLATLAIQSTYHDRFTPRRSLKHTGESTPYLDFLKCVRPGLKVSILPETGHFSMLERPHAVTELIHNFSTEV